MNQATGFLNKYVVPPLTVLSENTYMKAIRAGMVAIVPLTIIGGFFMIVAYMPIPGWEEWVEPYLPLLEIPNKATFGLLSIFVCFSIAYNLGKEFKQEAVVSGSMALLIFLMIQIDINSEELLFTPGSLDSGGLFTAILIALIVARVQKFFTDKSLIIKLPENVPSVVYESFASLIPLLFLVIAFWLIRFVLGVDINSLMQTALSPLVVGLDTLPGILLYTFMVTLLWSVGINGDNAMDAIVAPIFLMYLGANVDAITQGEPLPYVTALGFFTTFVNVGGTGATIALALILWNSKEPGLRKVGRVSMPTQIFQINEPIFFGIPIVLNPLLMVPYVFSAMALTTGTYLLMYWQVIQRPFVPVPWTTPPIIGHYLVSGGDWKAAVWGVVSIFIAIAIYYPFAKILERQRLQEEAAAATE
ncbi:MAG: PTS sugar transporter subunit IIC [Planctomycetales bacterium]|nr:PTS sugar transporter subunit IIC [Planctomycetales bacterium]